MKANGVRALLIRCFVMSTMTDVLNSSPHPKPIVNGRAARNNQFPFAVAFGLHPESSGSFYLFCGGTLISQSLTYSWAISAAHCFLDLKNRTVFARVGGGALSGDEAKWLRVLEIVRADVNIYTFQDDIALVKIEADHQQVIRRAREMPSNNAECLIYGYGSFSYEASVIYSNIIRYGMVKIISLDECEDILGQVTAPSQGTGQFCAHSLAVDACNGITSHGVGCGGAAAGVYESVVHHRLWIDSKLSDRRT